MNNTYVIGSLALLVAVLPSFAHAATITIRYSGTVDLTSFGGRPSMPFAGAVSWNPDGGWQSEVGCPDFCLDGTRGAVSGTFMLDSVDYTARIAPYSRLINWTDGLTLDLFFEPAIDLDGSRASDVRYVGFNLFGDSFDDPIIEPGLPRELPFSALRRRYVDFTDEDWCCYLVARADTLEVIPEPSVTSLLALGIAAACGVARKRRARAA